jgi:hypothetical protein
VLEHVGLSRSHQLAKLACHIFDRLQVWRINESESDLQVEFQGSLKKHNQAVNCIRIQGGLPALHSFCQFM